MPTILERTADGLQSTSIDSTPSHKSRVKLASKALAMVQGGQITEQEIETMAVAMNIVKYGSMTSGQLKRWPKGLLSILYADAACIIAATKD